MDAKRPKEPERKVDGVGRMLEEAERGPKKRTKPKDPSDLDLDGAWDRSQ